MPSLSANASFLKQFLKNPAQVGAIVPSSRCLSERLVEWLDLGNAKNVIEYGPGTGAMTSVILEQLRPGTRFVAIELDPVMARELRTKFPHVHIVEDSVENVRKICDSAGIDQVDCIVSGLPWANLPEELQKRLLDAMMTVLRPGGQFATFAYLHGLQLKAGRDFRALLPQYFSEIELSEPVWRNFPPASFYCCRR